MNTLDTKLARFLADDAGAVTVDWVVLTAGLVGLGLATTAVVSAGVEDVSGDTSGVMTDYEIETSFGVDWARQQWDASNPGIYDSYSSWMAGFDDAQLLAHMNNMEQYASYPAGSGHPYDTYHDEFFIARDEAIARGLVAAPS
ncbi:hypothetical protein [Alterinioella nitratireducens]|jgi:hypothetical protein|uniref:hypothetical protein n=1 Tax=Alterinioella nitratireducens TaxID=2735915 RepID=UPI000C926CB4|nr:hypothetical protein [Dinoroseobacter sp.]|tara:strand:+ start:48 stop:476 length:429 start_codon:yes stop_codon:yes gene_type:complete